MSEWKPLTAWFYETKNELPKQSYACVEIFLGDSGDLLRGFWVGGRKGGKFMVANREVKNVRSWRIVVKVASDVA